MKKPYINIYSVGLVSMSLCASNDATKEQIEAQANAEHPTMISSKWALSEDKFFHTGENNPCPCDQHPETHKHYLLTC